MEEKLSFKTTEFSGTEDLLKHLNNGKNHDFAKFAMVVCSIKCLPSSKKFNKRVHTYFILTLLLPLMSRGILYKT